MNNEDNHKDSCNYSIDISKQFLTLASAGIAFVIGLALVPQSKIFSSYYWTVGCYLFSIGLGLIYILSVIGHINRAQNYDIYTPQLRFLAFFQILTFLVGVVLLSYIVLNKINNNSKEAKSVASDLLFKVGDKELHYNIVHGSKIIINVSEEQEVE